MESKLDISKEQAVQLSARDFASDQDIRWCSCGDYSILKQVQSVMPDLGISEKTLFLFLVLVVLLVFLII